MERLKVFDGCPPPYDRKKKLVVPEALRVIRIRPGRKFCVLGRISHEAGWKYQDVVKKLEEKRVAKGKLYHEHKVKAKKALVKKTADKSAELKPVVEKLAAMGY
eukprot:Lithocolla_globosa_v1_NODE_9216_length_732_cov_4887.861152.p1 type:complete len:104 gc:universal NODE_9216_length_732_cov_4887.861152:730-419(-)